MDEIFGINNRINNKDTGAPKITADLELKKAWG